MEENKTKVEYNRYNNSKIYKLINTIDDTFYIGSTTAPLSKRLSWHKQNSKKENLKNIKVYQHLNIIGFENVKIVLINEFYLNNREELLRSENDYIEMYKNDPNCLNSYRAFLSEEEHNQYMKKYREDNKEKIIHLNKELYTRKREYILQQKKQYYIENMEHVKKLNNQNRIRNAEKIKQRKTSEYTCECGSIIQIDGKAKHQRTKKHINYLHDLNEESQTI